MALLGQAGATQRTSSVLMNIAGTCPISAPSEHARRGIGAKLEPLTRSSPPSSTFTKAGESEYTSGGESTSYNVSRASIASAHATPCTRTKTLSEVGTGLLGVTHSTSPSALSAAGTATPPSTHCNSSPIAAKPLPLTRTTSPPPRCTALGLTESQRGASPSAHQLKEAVEGPQLLPPSRETETGTVRASTDRGASHRTTVVRTKIATDVPASPNLQSSMSALLGCAKLWPSTLTNAPCPSGATLGAHSCAGGADFKSTSVNVRCVSEPSSISSASGKESPPPRDTDTDTVLDTSVTGATHSTNPTPLKKAGDEPRLSNWQLSPGVGAAFFTRTFKSSLEPRATTGGSTSRTVGEVLLSKKVKSAEDASGCLASQPAVERRTWADPAAAARGATQVASVALTNRATAVSLSPNWQHISPPGVGAKL
mmetsp:Transcript_12160/g.30593  ORF Transcript_12160/g.30593 Transcript_12160/m.30593 type:complete len:426 (-) Transcript_12160:820-2097(-)